MFLRGNEWDAQLWLDKETCTQSCVVERADAEYETAHGMFTNALALRPAACVLLGLPCTVWYTSIMAWATSGATGVVAALSR